MAPSLVNQLAATPSASVGAKVEYVTPPNLVLAPTATWPGLTSRFGTMPVSIPASGGGTKGNGGATAFPVGSNPNIPWISGESSIVYNLPIPLKLFSDANERCGPAAELFIVEHVMKYEFLTPPPNGLGDSGSFFQNTAGLVGGIVANVTGGGAGANTVFFGLGRHQVTGVFGWFGILGTGSPGGARSVFIPLTWPASDIRIPVKIQYKLFNSNAGLPARIEVYMNDSLVLRDTFTAGNISGLPFGYPDPTVTAFFNYAACESGQKLWYGDYRWACGPNNGTMT